MNLKKEMYFFESVSGKKGTRDEPFFNLRKISAFIAPGISTVILPDKPNELFDRIKLLLQWKQIGKISDIINEEIVAMYDEILEHKCSTNFYDLNV